MNYRVILLRTTLLLIFCAVGIAYISILAWGALQLADQFRDNALIHDLLVLAPFILFFLTLAWPLYKLARAEYLRSKNSEASNGSSNDANQFSANPEREMSAVTTIVAFLVLLCMAVAAPYCVDYVKHVPTKKDRLVSGTVIRRESHDIFPSVSRPKLTVRISETGESVEAVLLADGINDFNDSVTFYYSGDPNEEVLLLEESNPLWIALAFTIIPIAAGSSLIFLVHRKLLHKRIESKGNTVSRD